jgi:hypothetical protein
MCAGKEMMLLLQRRRYITAVPVESADPGVEGLRPHENKTELSAWQTGTLNILNERLHILDEGKATLTRTLHLRDARIIALTNQAAALMNQVAALERERSELKRTVGMRDSTIGYQAKVLEFFFFTHGPVSK